MEELELIKECINKLGCVCLSFDEKNKDKERGEALARRIFEIDKQLIELGKFLLPDLMTQSINNPKE